MKALVYNGPGKKAVEERAKPDMAAPTSFWLVAFQQRLHVVADAGHAEQARRMVEQIADGSRGHTLSRRQRSEAALGRGGR